MADTYLVNGVDLRSYAWRIETAEGLQDAPEFRGDDIVIPGQHGTLDAAADPASARRRYGPGQITFRMWLRGVDPDTGDVDPLFSLDEYLAQLSGLQRLFNSRSLSIEHPRADGLRRATGRLAAPIRPVREPSSPWFGRFTAACTIPSAFWTSDSDVTASATVATGGQLSLAPFATSEAPIANAVVTFGPGSNPLLVQGGTYLAYDGVIASGQQLVVDCASWEVGYGAGAVWTPDITKIRYGPGPSWFEIDPTGGSPAAVLTHTGGGAMAVSVTGRPAYLTS